MKNKFLVLILVGSLLITLHTAYAVGIQFYQTSVVVPEGKTSCIGYGAYNILDKEAIITLSATDDLLQFSPRVDKVTVPAQTGHQDTTPINICFTVPKLYTSNCKGLICEKNCPEKPKEFSGKIVAHEINSLATTATAPLTLIVACKQSQALEVVGLVIAAIIAFLAVAYVSKHKDSHNKHKKLQELRDLYVQVIADPSNTLLREQYELLRREMEFNNKRS